MTEATEIITPQPATTEIAEYSPTAAALAELRSKYENVIFPVDTTKGMKDAVAARKELRGLRTGLEKLRKEIKEPALRRCQLIDSEAKDITAQLTALEDPIDSQIKAEEKRHEEEKAERERVERERVAGIRTKIDFIKRLPLDSANDTADEIAGTISELETMEIGDDYAEFKDEAAAAKEAALMSLGALHTSTKAREEAEAQLKAEREQLERERAELARQRAEIEAAKAKTNEPTTPADPQDGSAGGEAPQLTLDTVLAEVAPAPVAEAMAAAEPVADDTAADQTMDANDLVSELAGYTAMQFFAMADKVASIGYAEFAAAIRDDGRAIAEGKYNEQLKIADWRTIAEADKRMALASHACVSVLEGDDELGKSVLRQQAA